MNKILEIIVFFVVIICLIMYPIFVNEIVMTKVEKRLDAVLSSYNIEIQK